MSSSDIDRICTTVVALGVIFMLTVSFAGWPWQRRRDDEEDEQ